MMPSIEREGASIKIISGEYEGVKGPARNRVESDYLDVGLKKGALFTFEKDVKMNSFCYVHTGSVSINGKRVSERELAEFDKGERIEIVGASERSGLLFTAGYPNNEPIVRGGPFVMNTLEEIEQAFEDYRKGVLF